jgi:hypothetical protein
VVGVGAVEETAVALVFVLVVFVLVALPDDALETLVASIDDSPVELAALVAELPDVLDFVAPAAATAVALVAVPGISVATAAPMAEPPITAAKTVATVVRRMRRATYSRLKLFVLC